MEQLTRGSFSKGGVTYKSVASPNGIVEEVGVENGYFIHDGEMVYPKVLEIKSTTIYQSTAELPTEQEGDIYLVAGLNGAVVYEYQTNDWVALKTLENGDLVWADGQLYMYDGTTLKVAGKSIIADYTIPANGWASNAYTLNVTGKTANNHALVSNSNTGTNQAVKANSEAIAEANIYKITDNGTSLTFVCDNAFDIEFGLKWTKDYANKTITLKE